MTDHEAATPTAPISFGSKTDAEASPVEATQVDTAQQEAMTAEANEHPHAVVQVDGGEAEATTEQPIENAPVDAQVAPVTENEIDNILGEASSEVAPEVDPEPVQEAVDPAAPVPENLIDTSVNTDGNNQSLDYLNREQERIAAQITAQKDAQKAAVLEQVKSVCTTYGITTADVIAVLGPVASKNKGTKVKPKYRDPVSGGEWSGRGRAPLWIKDKDKTQFLIVD